MDENLPQVAETSAEEPTSLRDELATAWSEAESAPSGETIETGTPANSPSPAPAPQVSQQESTPVADPTTQSTPADDLPPRLKEKWEAKWPTLDPEVKSQFRAYESDMGRLANRYGQAAQAWSRVEEVIAPHMQMIQAEGGNPLGAIASLLNTARILRTGTADQKLALVHGMIERYQIPMTKGEQGVVIGQPQSDPALLNRLAALETQALTSTAAADQNIRTEVNHELDAFLSDSSNVYLQVPGYMDVMAQLIQAGIAKDLADAYKQAAWKFDETRNVEIAKITKSQVQPKIQAAQEAKKAAVSVPGNSPGNPALDPSKLSVRETLAAAWDGEL